MIRYFYFIHLLMIFSLINPIFATKASETANIIIVDDKYSEVLPYDHPNASISIQRSNGKISFLIIRPNDQSNNFNYVYFRVKIVNAAIQEFVPENSQVAFDYYQKFGFDMLDELDPTNHVGDSWLFVPQFEVGVTAVHAYDKHKIENSTSLRVLSHTSKISNIDYDDDYFWITLTDYIHPSYMQISILSDEENIGSKLKNFFIGNNKIDIEYIPLTSQLRIPDQVHVNINNPSNPSFPFDILTGIQSLSTTSLGSGIYISSLLFYVLYQSKTKAAPIQKLYDERSKLYIKLSLKLNK